MNPPATKPTLDRVRSLLDAALARRADLRGVTTAYRLVDGAADGFAGLAVDRYGDWDVASVYDARATPLLGPVAEHLVRTGARGVYVKHHERGDLRRKERDDVAPREPLIGEAAPEELVVDEHGARLGVSLADGLSTGLFTDQRDNRQRIRGLSRRGRVLNLFSYTCSFTVAAALGGARETVSVDLSKRALERGRTNLSRNDVSLTGHRFIREDALVFVSRAVRRGERFDVVVLDPPSFGTRGRGTFSVERDYGELSRRAFALLAPGGALLAVTNHRGTTTARLAALVRDAALQAGTRVSTLDICPPPVDYPDRLDGEPSAKSVLATVGPTGPLA